MIGRLARFAFDLGRVVLAEAVERGSKRVVGLLMQAPDIREERADDDTITIVTDEQLAALEAARREMQSKPRRSRPAPVEDNSPLEHRGPLVGSLEWRSEQARPR